MRDMLKNRYLDKVVQAMTLKKFFKMHQNGCAQGCVSIHQEPYIYEKRGNTKTYFEECDQEEIEKSKIFKDIKNKQVDYFNIISGGIYPMELCVYLEREG